MAEPPRTRRPEPRRSVLPRPRGPAVRLPGPCSLRASHRGSVPWLVRTPLTSVSVPPWPCLRVSVSKLPSLLKTLSHWLRCPACTVSHWLDYICSDPLSEEGHVVCSEAHVNPRPIWYHQGTLLGAQDTHPEDEDLSVPEGDGRVGRGSVLLPGARPAAGYTRHKPGPPCPEWPPGRAPALRPPSPREAGDTPH